MFSQLLQVAAFVAPFVAGSPHSGDHARHRDLAKRMPGTVHEYDKRFSGSRWTYYAVGQGACGKVNQASDFIVALNSNQYGGGYPGPNCFKMITMSYNGKTTQAQIMDECPGCPWGGLDLSEGLFKFFASTDAGVLTGEWWFNDGSGDSQTTTKKADPTTTWTPEPTTTSTKKEEPTTTWKQETTSTWKPETTSSSSSWSSSSSSSSSKSSSSSSSSSWSSSAAPSSSSAAAAPTSGIESVEQVVLKLADFAIAGYQT